MWVAPNWVASYWDVIITFSIRCKYKLYCVKIYFLMPDRKHKAQFGLAIKIDIYIEK